MATTQDDYIIRARIVAEDLVDKATDSVTAKLQGIEDRAKVTGMLITTALGGAFTFIGNLAVFRKITSGIISMNSEVQEATFGMASLLSVQTGIGITDALKIARSEVVGLRKDAAAGVGEFSDYFQGFQTLLAPVLQAGGDTETVRSLTRNAIAGGFAEGNIRGGPQDIERALTKGIGEGTTPMAFAAIRAAGMTEQAFNKLDFPERLEALNDAFGKFAPVVELMGKTWSAQMSTMSESLQSIFRATTEPIFDGWVESLKTANDWLDRNKETISAIGQTIGKAVVRMWDIVISRTKAVAALMAGVAVTGVVAGGFMLAGSGAAAAALATVSTALLGLAPIAGVLALVLGGVTLIVMSLFDAWTVYPDTLERVRAATDLLGERLDLLGLSFTSIASEGSSLAVVGKFLNDFVVVPILESIADMVGGFAVLIVVIGNVVSFLTDAASLIVRALVGEIALGDLPGLISAREVEGSKAILDFLAPIIAAGKKEAGLGFVGPELPDDLDKLPTVKRITNIAKVEVIVKAETLDDPARVAIAWEEILDGIQRNPTQGKRNPFGSTELG